MKYRYDATAFYEMISEGLRIHLRAMSLSQKQRDYCHAASLDLITMPPSSDYEEEVRALLYIKSYPEEIDE